MAETKTTCSTNSGYSESMNEISNPDCRACQTRQGCCDLSDWDSSHAKTIMYLSERVSLQNRCIRLLEEQVSLLRRLLDNNGIKTPPRIINNGRDFGHTSIHDDRHNTACISDPGISSGNGTDAATRDQPIKDEDRHICPFPAGCGECSDLSDCYNLIDSLVCDILKLEEEMVNWRHALVRHLDPPDARGLQCDIFDHLAQRRFDDPAYQKYLRLFRYETDPMESDWHSRKLRRLANGTDEDSVHL